MNLKRTAIFYVLRSLLPLALISCVGSANGQETSIDTAHSKLLIHVSKSGLFSGFAGNHEVEAPIAKGSLDTKAGQLRLSVDSRQMRVRDPQLSSDKRQQVQERMAEQELEGRVRVDGMLSLHGVRKPVSVLAKMENGRYTGRFSLKQRDFGITPVSIAGGTVKVKDQLTIEFDILTTPGEKAK
jgi:YceI-like domain